MVWSAKAQNTQSELVSLTEPTGVIGGWTASRCCKPQTAQAKKYSCPGYVFVVLLAPSSPALAVLSSQGFAVPMFQLRPSQVQALQAVYKDLEAPSRQQVRDFTPAEEPHHASRARACLCDSPASSNPAEASRVLSCRKGRPVFTASVLQIPQAREACQGLS